MNYILGIDVGTSNVKAVLFDMYGNEASVASQESKTISAGRNEVEQDMNAVREKVKYCVKTVVASGVA